MSKEPRKKEHISEEAFGVKMRLWENKGMSPLQAINLAVYEDDNGEFYLPSIEDYSTGDKFTTGSKNGYEKMEPLLGVNST